MSCYPDNSFAIPDKFLTPAPFVIPAQAGADPPPSFQRRLESSGLDNSFPQSGNDRHGEAIQSGACKIRQSFDFSGFVPWIPRRPVPDAALPPASMQASLRWNDDE